MAAAVQGCDHDISHVAYKAGLELQTFQYIPYDWADEAAHQELVNPSTFNNCPVHEDVTWSHLVVPMSCQLLQPAPEWPSPYQTVCHQSPLVSSTQSEPISSFAVENPYLIVQEQSMALSQQCASQPIASKTPGIVDASKTPNASEPVSELDVEAPAPLPKGNKGSKKKPNANGQGCSGRDWQETDTTVMLRNISSRYTAEEVLAELMDRDFQDTFDMLYLPMDFKSHRNMGYAFINFVKPSDAKKFANVFQGLAFTRYKSIKVLEVTRAFTQGLQANLEAYQRKDAQRVRNPWFRPMVFDVEGSMAESLEIVRNWNMAADMEANV